MCVITPQGIHSATVLPACGEQTTSNLSSSQMRNICDYLLSMPMRKRTLRIRSTPLRWTESTASSTLNDSGMLGKAKAPPYWLVRTYQELRI